ncbi:MAG: hypothetical protein IKP31_01485 [Lachnospiraceae bacterium]|nr:hypothetical protein [Lachnospiraceae bacterium]
MKKIIVVYDDSRKPGQEISAITGKKSYGNIIFKRQSLKKRAEDNFTDMDNVELFIDASSFDVDNLPVRSNDNSVFRLYSDQEITDMDAVKILLEKSLYAKENYAIYCNDKPSAIIYPSVNAYVSGRSLDESNFERIGSQAFADLSDATVFRTFITSGFDARFFNALSGDEYTVIKSSDNVDKLRMEYRYFTMLPPEMKQWFATAYGYEEEDNRASYRIERYHMTDLALRYVHGAIDEDEFRAVMEILFHFISIRKEKQVSDEEYEQKAKALYLDKVSERTERLKQLNGYERIREYIASGTEFKDIDEIIERYRSIYDSITAGRKFKKLLTVGHGDLCFSNILYNHDARLLRLIDPKGAMEEDEMYMNPYYDLAKLSHSICGLYDYFNSDQYEIVLGDNMKLELKIDCDNDRYVDIFKEYLDKNGFDIRLIRLYEASLFLSMLPLHMDREKKVFGFILNALNILDELEKK